MDFELTRARYPGSMPAEQVDEVAHKPTGKIATPFLAEQE
jgi:hypothetical protein